MRIAVTGAAGWVGSAVVEAVAEAGHDVVAIDREIAGARPGGFVEADMRDYEAVLEGLAGCDALIHLAAINGPGRHPDHVIHDNNVISSYHALRAAAEVGIHRVCQASSVNAIGGRFSREPRFDYFPVDEGHPPYVDDPYSLSKLICEQQADAFARRFPEMGIASIRLHGVVESRADTAHWVEPMQIAHRQLWGYTTRKASAQACLRGVTADFAGHQAFFAVAPETMVDTPSLELRDTYYPDVEVRGDLAGNRGFFDCSRAAAILGWEHED
jgi:UDP-glucose 4-epimerase